MYKIIVSCLYLFFVTTAGSKICKVPNGSAGECKVISKCTPLQALDNKISKSETEKLFLQQSMCGSLLSPVIKVCCPPTSQWNTFKIRPVLYPGLIKPSNGENPDPPRKPEPTPKPVPLKIPEPTRKPQPTPKPTVDVPNIDNVYNIDNKGSGNDDSDEIGYAECGIDAFDSNKIVGGTATNIDQYPWLALLEYQRSQLLCGGSLISAKYVLTAAHCTKTIYGPPLFVRLAEYNTTSFPTDYVRTDGGGIDSSNVTIIAVEKILAHPQYNGNLRIHDIGIIKLAKKAIFSDFIKTICLPPIDLTSKFTRKTNFTVAGWGSDEMNESSDVKKHVSLPFVDEGYCKKLYRDLPMLNVVCAGGESGKDSCDGDSGGPLMYEMNQKFYAVGVLSFGNRICGLEGKAGVYVSVFKYMKWITDVVEGRIQN